MKKSEQQKKSQAEEMTRRGAAGMANGTAGRARVFKDKTKYDRREGKSVDFPSGRLRVA